jgi:hypothetical protein
MQVGGEMQVVGEMQAVLPAAVGKVASRKVN